MVLAEEEVKLYAVERKRKPLRQSGVSREDQWLWQLVIQSSPQVKTFI